MDRVFLSVKVCGKERHREAFLDGDLHLNPLGYFRKYEEGAVANVADRHEGTISLHQPGQFTVTLTCDELPDGQYTIPAEDFAGPVVIQRDGDSALNVLCLYAVHERGHVFESDDDFESFVAAQMLKPEVDGLGEFAALVFDTGAFQSRVLHAVRDKGFGLIAGLVDYYDPATFSGTFGDAEAVLKKRAEYSHQREYRFAVDRGIDEEAAYTLHVGSLRDIALGCRTAEVNGLIRELLHQLRSQGVFGSGLK